MTVVDEECHGGWLADRVAAARPVSEGAMCLAGGIPVNAESIARSFGSALAELHTISVDDCPFPALDGTVLANWAHARVEAAALTAADGPYRGIAPARLLDILDDQMADLGDAKTVIVHGSLSASDVWFHPESGLSLTTWDHVGLGDCHLDLAMGAKLLGDTYGYAVVAPFFEAYDLDRVDAVRLDAFQLLVHLLTT
ncbi:MAG: phosphotransferase [Acidimicrobiaceae bacterium]|jgi:aminoglycoside phosphotransferase|nr:phosphotransferase [Acidimicrobiaceae bacterium]MBT5581027.1 phosphotransferase [Acidimicrobiaceae bacterium]MBT5851066.1 phosphotransferase [Acidimicrobiaceae bacterium]